MNTLALIQKPFIIQSLNGLFCYGTYQAEHDRFLRHFADDEASQNEASKLYHSGAYTEYHLGENDAHVIFANDAEITFVKDGLFLATDICGDTYKVAVVYQPQIEINLDTLTNHA
ncbi:hypothetical protein [Acinetobacter sp. P1(2025)]|uniref:hypothetical protein n=1 Tax=Acinetobacter sp. P1(2025) TaxID=3446120 RepID=UPI003F53BFD3